VNRFETVELVPFGPGDMHALVADVALYPRFLPWVKAARLWDRKPGEPKSHFKAELLVGFKTFRAPFATTVDTDTAARTIETRLIRGPFRTLACHWRFEASPSGTLIHVAIDYEFADPLLRMLLSANINTAVNRLVSAFTGEAERRYTSVTSG
jgi:coenzyme Q-binding protein COQ10